ncbi:putative membrane protein YqjE [Peribacillus huizhouensis]|uniref:Membrane protein YqjE n=1 Tax=Peribacillus huizhouensis TaxID=1501239 RepID=A0ABR6CUV9_9BACI|nr:putative membrane protein YqjE [Peribacillus huizhouensis]
MDGDKQYNLFYSDDLDEILYLGILDRLFYKSTLKWWPMKMLIAFVVITFILALVGEIWEVSKSDKKYSGSTKKIVQT